MLTVTTVTNFCFTYPNWDGLYTPPLNSWKIGKWLKTLEKVGFSKVFENGEKLNPPLSATLQVVRASRTQDYPQEISTPQTLRPAITSMNGKIESCERPGPCHQSFATQTGQHLPRLARAAPQKFSPVLRRAERFADGHVDDAPRDQLARLSPHRLGVPAGRRRLRGTNPHISFRALRRSLGGPPESPQCSARHASARDAAILRARRSRPEPPHHHSRNHLA